MDIMELFFWIQLGLIFYCYFGYPLALWVIRQRAFVPVDKQVIEPAVSILVSAYNEEDVIEDKIKNLLALDYPKEKMEIIMASDGSTDATAEVMARYAGRGIQYIEHPERQGKMVVLNDLVQRAKHGIIVFTDARQVLDARAVRELAANFHDPNIGAVTGELVLSTKASTTAQGINLYWSYEKWLRFLESSFSSILGVTGAIYAIRKKLFVPIPRAVVLDDMFVPLNICLQGYRVIFDNTAVAYDEVAESPRQEYHRKVRTLAGNYQIFKVLPQVFNPFRSPVAIQMFSHKLLRLLVPFFMIGVYFTNWDIARDGNLFYSKLFYIQSYFYIMAIVGALARYKNRGILKAIAQLCGIPYMFCLLNFSALNGFWRFMTGSQDVKWTKARTGRIDS